MSIEQLWNDLREARRHEATLREALERIEATYNEITSDFKNHQKCIAIARDALAKVKGGES